MAPSSLPLVSEQCWLRGFLGLFCCFPVLPAELGDQCDSGQGGIGGSFEINTPELQLGPLLHNWKWVTLLPEPASQ